MEIDIVFTSFVIIGLVLVTLGMATLYTSFRLQHAMIEVIAGEDFDSIVNEICSNPIHEFTLYISNGDLCIDERDSKSEIENA